MNPSRRIRRAHCIAEADAAAWDFLAADDAYARYGWLRTLEQTVAGASHPVYFLAEEDGVLRGAAICYRMARGSHALLDGLLFGRLRPALTWLGLSLHPALVCGPLIGQGRHLLWMRDDPDAAAVIDDLCDAMTRYAAEERLSLAVVKLPADEHELARAFSARGLARTMNWPANYIDIRWNSFDAYVADLGTKRSTAARRERGAPARAGIAISQEPRFGDEASRLFQLIEGNLQAHSGEPLVIDAGFFEVLASQNRDCAVLNVARADDKLVGAALLLVAGRCAGGPLIGLDEDARNRKAFTYFNLALYEPVHWCIAHGVGRLYLGAGLYAAKRRRGCDVMALSMFIRHRRAAARWVYRLLCRLHRQWVRTKLAREGVVLAANPSRPRS